MKVGLEGTGNAGERSKDGGNCDKTASMHTGKHAGKSAMEERSKRANKAASKEASKEGREQRNKYSTAGGKDEVHVPHHSKSVRRRQFSTNSQICTAKSGTKEREVRISESDSHWGAWQLLARATWQRARTGSGLTESHTCTHGLSRKQQRTLPRSSKSTGARALKQEGRIGKVPAPICVPQEH